MTDQAVTKLPKLVLKVNDRVEVWDYPADSKLPDGTMTYFDRRVLVFDGKDVSRWTTDFAKTPRYWLLNEIVNHRLRDLKEIIANYQTQLRYFREQRTFWNQLKKDLKAAKK